MKNKDLKLLSTISKVCIMVFICLLSHVSLAQHLEIALYKAKLSEKEMIHITEGLRFEIDFYNALFGDSIKGNIKARFFGSHPSFINFSKERTPLKRPHEVAGYFIPHLNELIVYKNSNSDRFLQVYSHELSHALLEKKFDNSPYWLNEGLAEFFESIVFSKEGSRSNADSRTVNSAYGVIKSKTSLERFFSRPYSDWQDSSRVMYALSWAIVNYFYFNKLEEFLEIISELGAGRSSLEAINSVYDRGFDEFHKDIRNYYRKLRNGK